jgi:hypothetical protein
VDAAKLDRSLIWGSSPDVTYGIDLAMQFTNLDIRFGGMLGYLTNMNRGADRIKDRTVTVSASYYLAPPEQ